MVPTVTLADLPQLHAKRCSGCPGDIHSRHWTGFLNTHKHTLIDAVSSFIDSPNFHQHPALDKEKMLSFGLLPFIQTAARRSLKNQVKKHVVDTVDEFEPVDSYIDEGLVFLRDLIEKSPYTTEGTYIELEATLYRTFFAKRLEILVDMIHQYPNTENALEDWSRSFPFVSTQGIQSALKEEVMVRLLHQGIPTWSILKFYLNTHIVSSILGIKLDTHSILLYLRSRPDVVKCTLAMIMDPKGEFKKELQAPDLLSIDEWDEDKTEVFNLTPILLDIHGEGVTEVFRKEIGKMIADKLVKLGNYCHDTVVKDLEVLKIIFGEGLGNCEVMLLDVSASRRVDLLIQAAKVQPVHALMISELFWPDSEEEKEFVPHPVLKGRLDVYAESYMAVKSDRRLVFKERIGTVNLSLELDGGVVKEFACSPVQASIILMFDEGANKELGVDLVMLKRKLSREESEQELGFWVRSGVLEKNGAKYRVVETLEDDEDADVAMGESVVVSTGGETAASTQLTAQQIMMVGNFAIGAIKNSIGGEPANAKWVFDKIKVVLGGMMKLGLEDVGGVLEGLVGEERLEVSGGVYSIKK